MEGSSYINVFNGNFLIVQQIIGALKDVNINAIIKDESESSRLAGFGNLNQGYQEVFVHESEKEKADEIINKIKTDLKI